MSKIFFIIIIKITISIFILPAQTRDNTNEMPHAQRIKELPQYLLLFTWNAIALIPKEKITNNTSINTDIENRKIRLYFFSSFQFFYNFQMNHIENLFTLHYTWSVIDSTFIPASLPFLKNRNASSKTINIFYRLTKLFLIDYPIYFIIPSLNHEFFGHGMRYYQQGLDLTNIYLPLPPPFQSTFPYINADFGTDNATIQQSILSTIGGSEANTNMANIVRKTVLVSGSFSYQSSFLYLYANNDLNGYAAFAPQISDIAHYKYLINEILYKNRSKKIDNTKLLTYGIIGILGDPLNYYSFYNIFKSYLFDGKTSFRIPWIPIYEVKYLPKVRFGLTPYGVELFINTYLAYEDTVYAFIIGTTDGTFEPSWRIQTKIWNILITKDTSIDIDAQIWMQPKIEFFVNNILQKSQGFGYAFFITYDYDNFISNILGITFQLGYKSAGFIEGHVLQNSVTAQIAFSISSNL